MLKHLIQKTSIAMAVHADRAFVEWVIKGRVPGRAPGPYMREVQAKEYIEEIERASQFYDPARMSDAQAFPEPGVPESITQTAGTLWRKARHLTWRSEYTVLRDTLHEEFHTPANERVHAYKFGDGGHRAVVCVHGYMGGHLDVEALIWPVEQFMERGFDVFLITLPHHGPRMASLFGKPLFPENARHTVEGICQSVFDVRALVSVLIAQGYEHVGLSGMSLGGYVASLSLGIDPRLSFCIPLIPLTDFAQMSHDFDALAGEHALTRARHKRAISSLCRLIDPLARKPLLAPEHVMVVAGESDGVLSAHQSRALAQHLGCQLVHFKGGHLMQRGRRSTFEQALDMAQRACR